MIFGINIMRTYKLPDNETNRLEALVSYNILDTPPEIDYDEITQLAATICNCPISAISLIDEDRQWFKSAIGLGVNFTAREISFCTHAIVEPNKIFIIPDATLDQKFVHNPLVTGDPHIKFYAGSPLVTKSGFALGTICVIDIIPKNLNEEQLKALEILAKQVTNSIERRKTIIDLKEQENNLNKTAELLSEQNKRLTSFSYIVSHNLRSHSANIDSLINLINITDKEQDKKVILGKIQKVACLLNETLTHLNDIVKVQTQLNIKLENIILYDYIIAICDSFDNLIKESQITININVAKDFCINSNAAYLESILLNFISNAIKYYDPNKKSFLTISANLVNGKTVIEFSDNGLGIDLDKNGDDLFGMYKVFTKNSNSRGLGLFLVKNQIEALGGFIEVESELGRGSKFKIHI